MTAAPQEIPRGAHLGGIDRGLGEHTAPQQDRNLVGVDVIVLGFAPMNRFHIESVPQDKGDPLLGTEIRQPLPGAQAFHSHDEVFPLGSNDPQERFRGGWQILVPQLRAALIQNTDVHRLGM